MRTMLLAAAALAAAAVFHTAPAHAQNYPYCLKNSAGPGDCKYTSYAQCEAAASGINGYCEENTWLPRSDFVPSYEYEPARGHRRYAPQFYPEY
jgi:Protein of unknown function (DUF3551)